MVLQPVGASLQEGIGEFMFSSCNVLRPTLARRGWTLVVCLLWGGRLALAAEATSGWDVDRPMGPQWTQTIDVAEGTWIHVDVSPDGQQIVFDLLGDLYLMPVTGADGRDGSVRRKLTSGVSWDMQPRFSPDGAHVAFTSDRQGKVDVGETISGALRWTVPSSGKLRTRHFACSMDRTGHPMESIWWPASISQVVVPSVLVRCGSIIVMLCR